MEDHALIDAERLAALLGCARSTIYDLTAQGRLPHVKIGRLVRYDEREVLAFLKVTGR